jgi:hypothetical protein
VHWQDAPLSQVSLGESAQQAAADVRAAPADRAARWGALAAVLVLILALLLFASAGAYQLQLPGLHYDEAKEAGVNAMQLLTGQPVTAFRDATIAVGPLRIPLMVQDYIGNLNVLLAVPFLAIGGVNTVALRALPLVLGVLTLLLTWKIAARLGGMVAATATVILLAVNPTFVFWSRQGIFVTNITVLFFMAALWFGIVWWQGRRPVHLVLVALSCGLGVYAKLLFVWAAIALFVVGVCLLLLETRNRGNGASVEADGAVTRHDLPGWRTLAVAAIAFLLPVAPLILFNVKTGGTFISIFGHLGRSYYGVDNSAYGSNLLVRVEQVYSLLRSDHLWYLGGANADEYATWLFLGLIVLSAVLWWLRTRRGSGRMPGTGTAYTPALPLALFILIVLQSAFTVSDLFITHFALVTPLIPLAAGLALGEVVGWARGGGRTAGTLATALAVMLVTGWVAADAYTVVRYHRALTLSGGFVAHSDAIYKLAGYLDEQGYGSPVALDWGIDAPVSFLTEGRVQPVDVFGYEQLDAPDEGFMKRITPYLDSFDTIWIAHPPEKEVFHGRQQAIEALTTDGSSEWLEQIRFGQRSGETMFIIHRFLKK